MTFLRMFLVWTGKAVIDNDSQSRNTFRLEDKYGGAAAACYRNNWSASIVLFKQSTLGGSNKQMNITVNAQYKDDLIQEHSIRFV